MTQKWGDPVPPCMPVSEHHEHPEPLAPWHFPLLADYLENSIQLFNVFNKQMTEVSRDLWVMNMNKNKHIYKTTFI